MVFLNCLTLLGAIGFARAHRPSDVSICDYYTTALLTDNTAANQYTVLTLVVNTALIGNYTTPNVGIAVPGILNPGMYNGVAVNLLPYFDGGFMSINANNMTSVMTFLDGGAAAALEQSLPAFDNTSNQYFLLTHLYEYFGLLLGCTQVGSANFPAYGGDPSMYDVHKFMALDQDEIGYFITQVGLSAESFGVTPADASAVGTALTTYFNYRCSPPNGMIIPGVGPQLDSICLAESCPLDPTDPTCTLYDNTDGYSPQPAPYDATTITPAMMATSCPAAAPPSTVTVTETTCPTSMMTMMSMAPAPSPSVYVTMSSAAAPAMPSSVSCPSGLSGNYQFPHLIVPISSAYPDTAYGTSYFPIVNSTFSTIFEFDIPASYAGGTCSLVFLFPTQSELTTSSFTLSGSGSIDFVELSSPATTSTSYSDAPSVLAAIGTLDVMPGNSYTLATYPCPAGERVSIEASATGSLSLNYFQDSNPSPIGLYINLC